MKLKLCTIGFFFCLIAAIGWVTISDTEMPIPLPIDGAFSIQGKSNLSNNEVYEMVRDVSKGKGYHLQANRSEFGSVEVCKF